MTDQSVKADQTTLITPEAIAGKGERFGLGDFAIAFRAELHPKEMERLAVSVKRSGPYELGDSRFAVPPRWLIDTQVFGFCCDWRFRK